MSRLLDDDQDDLTQRERELTLSTGAILAIFLGLVLLCAVFFGFGYNLGRKSTTVPNAPQTVATNDAQPASTESSTFDNFKPSPSSPSAPSPTATAPTTPAPTPAPSATAASANDDTHTVAVPVHTNPVVAPTKPPASPVATPSAPAHASQPPAPAITPGGAFVVQIAAISVAHKDDADLVVNALHSKGYQVSERTEPQDKLIHIQVGPFATKADAEAMRERLVVDGYNPIVK
jgi:DedD protein